MSGLINIAKYVTQVGQLRRMAANEWGDPQVTSIQTISCLVYQDSTKRQEGEPRATGGASHVAVIPTSVESVSLHDHLTNVVDRFGSLVIEDARITQITAFGDWRHGNKFRQLFLDVNLG